MSWSLSIWTRRASRTRCWWGSRPNGARGCRRCWPPAMWCIAINPMQVARYRERHSTSGAKSDPADAHLLAEIVRLDRAHHRPVAGDSEIAEHVKVAARAHQTMIWSRVRQVNALRSLLREYYPAALAAFGTDLARPGRVGGAGRRPDPGAGPAAVPGPDRNPAPQGRPATQPRRHRSQDPDRAGHRTADRPARCGAGLCGVSASALIAVLTTMVAQTEVLAGQVEQGFGQHPDVEIYRSQPGLGDDPRRPGAGRVRRRPRPLRRREEPEELLRHVTDHQGLRHQTGRAGPLRPQPTPRRRAVPAGLQRAASPHPEPGPTTTSTAPAAPPTTKPSAPSRTGSSASSTAACATTPSTTNTAPGTPNTSSPSPPEPGGSHRGIPPDQPIPPERSRGQPAARTRPITPKLDRGEHRHTIKLGGIPPLTHPVVGCLVRLIFRQHINLGICVMTSRDASCTASAASSTAGRRTEDGVPSCSRGGSPRSIWPGSAGEWLTMAASAHRVINPTFYRGAPPYGSRAVLHTCASPSGYFRNTILV